MPARARTILDQIADLQSTLEGFSFDQLTVAEAYALKSSFTAFRSLLESGLWAPSGSIQGLPDSFALPDREESRAPEEDINQIIARVGHELQPPLGAIQGLAQMLLAEPLSRRQTEHIQAIQKASQTVHRLVGELLEYSAMHTNREPLACIAFSPKQLIRQVGYLCETLIVSKSLKLELTLDPRTPDTLHGDPASFSQILMNLLGDAIKSVQEGAVSLQIWPEFLPGCCVLHGIVRDTGPGISPEELPHIFEVFRPGRECSAPTQNGSGLGLSIAKKTLDRLGGTISADSRPGAGTEFRFRIPFRQAGEAESSLPETLEEKRPLSGKTILVIKGNLLNQKLIETRLEGWGCRVLTSEKALNAIGLLSEIPVDLILLDLQMPGMDGFQASARIRNHPEASVCTIPILAVTADLTAESYEQARRAGIDDVLLRPCSAEELLDKMLAQLKNRQGSSFIQAMEEQAREESISLDGIWAECLGDLETLDELVNLFRSNLLEFLGALKTHLTLLDYEQIASCTRKIESGLKWVEAWHWLDRLDELRALNRSQSGVKRMRQIYREMLEDYPAFERELAWAVDQIKKDCRHD